MVGKINSNYNTLLSVAFGIIALLVTLCVDFFLSPFIVKNIGVEANGYVQIANNLVTIASLLTIALNSMGSRFVAIEYNRGKLDECKKYYSSLFVGNLLIVLVLVGPSIFCVWKLEFLFDISGVGVFDAKILFLFAFLNFFVSQFVSLFNIGPFVKNQMYFCYISNTIIVILKGILYIIIYSIFKPKIFYITLIALLTNILSFCFLFLIKKRIMPDVRFSFKDVRFKYAFSLIKSGFWNSINQCGNILMTGFDLILTNWVIGPTAMGLLAVSKTMPNVIVTLSTTLNNSILAGQTISYAKESKEEYSRQIEFSIKVSTIFVLVPIVIFIVFSYKFYKLWQPTLDSSQLALLSALSVLALVPLSGVQILYNVLTTMNKLKVNAISFLITGLINIGLTLLLVVFTDLSIFAVAGVSSILSCIRYLVLMLPYISNLLGKKRTYFLRYVRNSLLYSLLIAAICLPFVLTIGISWRELIVSIFIVALLSIFSLYKLSFSKNEQAIIRRMIRRNKQ